jgi:hypothetical protein
MHTRHLLTMIALGVLAAPAWAKLPPPSDEAKAKAAEAAAKTAHSGKVEAYQLCKSMDKLAAEYYAAAKKAGKELKPPTATPACADPGPFVYVPPEPRPLEASGAHSPPPTATSPPSTKQPEAEMKAARKP